MPELFALLAAFSAALYESSLRACGNRGCDSYTLGFVDSLAAAIIIAALLPLEGLSRISAYNWMILFIGGCLWALMVFWDIKAYRAMDVSLNALLNTGRFILLTLAGVVLFNEQISLLDGLGLGLVLAAILYGMEFKTLGFSSGVQYRLLSIAAGTFAVIVDKYLTTVVPIELVVLAGFAIPAVFFVLCRPGVLSGLAVECKKGGAALALSIVSYVALGYFLVFGMGTGQLWTTLTIYRLRVVLALIIAAVFLGEVEKLRKRSIAAVLSVLGVIIVAVC